jgi:N-acetylglucosaminyl-diphospho-decaprenol L-rhamnosyltransferase
MMTVMKRRFEMRDSILSKVELLVLVITYADLAETRRTLSQFDTLLSQIEAEKLEGIKLVVWDNGSLELDYRGQIAYFSSPQGNIGFGAAVNAVRARFDFDRILLVNPDIDLDWSTFSTIIAHNMVLPSETIWAPMLVNADGTDQTRSNSLYMRTVPQEILDMFGFPARRQRRKVALYYLRGAVFSISSKMLDAAGGFDEDFFLYGEEADLCFRLQDSATLSLDERVRVVHHGSQGHKGKSPKALEYSLDARVRLHRKYNGAVAGHTVAFSVSLLKLALGLKRAIDGVRKAAAASLAGGK